MLKKELLFKPKRPARLKKSLLYGMWLFSRIAGLSLRFLRESQKKNNGIVLADECVKEFWQLNFNSTFTSLYVTGREYLKDNETYVFISNHESWLDIPAIFAAVPGSLRMVTKVGLTKVPVFGQALLAAGFIAIDRQNRTKAIRQLAVAKERLNAGISIWIAAEGTRSRDGKIAPFKKGGFHLAHELQKSIVPVFIEGAAAVMPPDSLSVYTNKSITVHFCPPVSTKDLAKSALKDLVETVRNTILAKQQECIENQNK